MLENNVQSITFFYPSKNVGGVEFLFSRLAVYLSENFPVNICYIDYKDGFARKNISNNLVTFIDYDDNPRNSINIANETFLITTSHIKHNLFERIIFSNNEKLLFWSTHPYDVITLIPFIKTFINLTRPSNEGIRFFIKLISRYNVKKIQNILQLLHNKNALVFMDYPNFKTNNTCFDLTLNERRYIPVALEDSDKSASNQPVQREIINICVLGRLVKGKIYPLINIITNSNIYADKYNKKVRIHIIGKGNKEYLLDNISLSKNVELIKAGTITNENLDDYLVNKIDILFAMGTSCLEGAKLKLPSVLLDFSYNPINHNYKFKWLFESSEYSLGDSIQDLEMPNKNTFEEIINDVYINNNKQKLGERCRKYFQDNHTIKATANIFLTYLKNNNLTSNDFLNTNYRETTFIHKFHKFLSQHIKGA